LSLGVAWGGFERHRVAPRRLRVARSNSWPASVGSRKAGVSWSRLQSDSQDQKTLLSGSITAAWSTVLDAILTECGYDLAAAGSRAFLSHACLRASVLSLSLSLSLSLNDCIPSFLSTNLERLVGSLLLKTHAGHERVALIRRQLFSVCSPLLRSLALLHPRGAVVQQLAFSWRQSWHVEWDRTTKARSECTVSRLEYG